ncbi:MAG: sulfotransferase domain-containing protein [Verrucomicrobiota bacterium]|jgi:hypothetical protein
MELYFDRPRLREVRTTLFDKSRTDWMWFHDHDLDLKIQHRLVLYLYRDPVSTFFSNLTYYAKLPDSPLFNKSPLAADEKTLLKFCDDYREHLQKWLLSENKAHTAIRYDKLKSDTVNEFQKICRFFGRPFDKARMEQAFATVTPRALAAQTVDPAAIGGHLLKKSYDAERRQFSETWEKYIGARVIVPGLRPWFD